MGCASSAEKVVVLDDLAAVRTASGRAPCGKFLSADDYNRASACWTLRQDFSLDTFAGHLERVVRLQSIFRGYAIRKRVRIDQNVFKLLRQAEASWAGPHAAVPRACDRAPAQACQWRGAAGHLQPVCQGKCGALG